jgi:hypothetical protein
MLTNPARFSHEPVDGNISPISPVLYVLVCLYLDASRIMVIKDIKWQIGPCLRLAVVQFVRD